LKENKTKQVMKKYYKFKVESGWETTTPVQIIGQDNMEQDSQQELDNWIQMLNKSASTEEDATFLQAIANEFGGIAEREFGRLVYVGEEEFFVYVDQDSAVYNNWINQDGDIDDEESVDYLAELCDAW